MADWQAFATSFLTGVASDINKRKDKAEDYETQQRDLAERNKTILSKRNSVVGMVKSKAQKLLGLGISEEAIRAATASGPNGLIDLERNIDKAVATHGEEAVRKNAAVFASTDVDPSQVFMEGEGKLTLDEYINRSFGMQAPTPGSVEAGEGTIWDRMLGRNAKERTKAKLDSEMSAMGYSIYDINQAAAQSDYESMAPGAYVNYGDYKTFGITDKAKEVETIGKMVTALREGNEEYDELSKRQQQLTKDYASQLTVDPEQAAATKEELDAVMKRKREIEAPIIGDHVNRMGSAYPDGSYAEIMGPTLSGIFGDTSYMSTPTETPGSTAEAASGGTVETATPPIGTTPEVTATVTNVPVEAEIGKIASNEAFPGVPMTAVLGGDGAEYVRVDQDFRATINGASRIFRKGELLDATTSKAIIEGSDITASGGGPRTRPVMNNAKKSIQAGMQSEEYSLGLDPMADRLLTDSGDAIVQYAKQEGIDSSVSDEELTQIASEWAVANGQELPMDKTNLLKGLRFGLKAAPEEEAPVETPVDTSPAPTPEAEQMDAIEADATSDRILRSSARDIVALAEQEGLTAESTDEEIVQILSEWAVANDETLPMDKGSLVYAIRYGLGL